MKLHELEVGDSRAGQKRERDAVAGRDGADSSSRERPGRRRPSRAAWTSARLDEPAVAIEESDAAGPPVRRRSPARRSRGRRPSAPAAARAVRASTRPISRPVASCACSTRRTECAPSCARCGCPVGQAVERRAPVQQLARRSAGPSRTSTSTACRIRTGRRRPRACRQRAAPASRRRRPRPRCRPARSRCCRPPDRTSSARGRVPCACSAIAARNPAMPLPTIEEVGRQPVGASRTRSTRRLQCSSINFNRIMIDANRKPSTRRAGVSRVRVTVRADRTAYEVVIGPGLLAELSTSAAGAARRNRPPSSVAARYGAGMVASCGSTPPDGRCSSVTANGPRPSPPPVACMTSSRAAGSIAPAPSSPSAAAWSATWRALPPPRTCVACRLVQVPTTLLVVSVSTTSSVARRIHGSTTSTLRVVLVTPTRSRLLRSGTRSPCTDQRARGRGGASNPRRAATTPSQSCRQRAFSA